MCCAIGRAGREGQEGIEGEKGEEGRGRQSRRGLRDQSIQIGSGALLPTVVGEREWGSGESSARTCRKVNHPMAERIESPPSGTFFQVLIPQVMIPGNIETKCAFCTPFVRARTSRCWLRGWPWHARGLHGARSSRLKPAS